MAESAAQSQGSSGGDSNQVNVDELMSGYRDRLEQTSSALDASTRELTGLKAKVGETDQTLTAMRKALGVKTGDEPAPDPFEDEIKGYQSELDTFLQAAIDAERAGKPIPLTARSAINSLNGLIEKTRQLQRAHGRLDTVEETVRKVSNPAFQIDQQAFASMDGMVMSALNTLYGDDETTKAVQFQAVTKLIGGAIKGLDGQTWDRVRRNPADQRKLVNHFMEQTIPPAARRLLEDEKIRTTPLTVQDLWAAWQEAKEISDPRQRAEIQDTLRPQLLERIYYKNRGDRSGKGINALY